MTTARGASVAEAAAATLAWLEENADPGVRAAMGSRYGIHTDLAFGMPMARIKGQAKSLGIDHDLAAALWATGWYEARLIACKIDDPALVSSAQMDAWCHDFDNWAICDTVCFSLFDRTPQRWEKVDEWVDAQEEFVVRAAFDAVEVARRLADSDDPARRRVGRPALKDLSALGR